MASTTKKKPKARAKSDADRGRQYEIDRDRVRDIHARQGAAGRDIAPLPQVVNPARRAACGRDFRLFCETYFHHLFYIQWSADHLKVIGKIEAAVLNDGLFAVAMPRSWGKTSLCETAVLWATVYGHRRFVVIIGSDEASAAERLESVKVELDSNEKMAEDFPEVCYPFERLAGISKRCEGQLYEGKRTHIWFGTQEVVYPTIPGSAGAGAIIKSVGLTGGIRGMKFKRPDGGNVRPDLVVLDDPQTDASAASPSQCATREALLAGAVLGMAGPGKKIAAVMPCTVIRSGDMADRILNRKIHPQWQGERTKLIYSFPAAEKLWDQYAQMRADSFRADGNGSEATEFYRENRAVMDAGAVVAWPERHEEDELSAVQFAMNLRFRDERAFFAEYQNEPKTDAATVSDVLTADEIAAKLSGIDRGIAPIGASHLTAFIDVQKTVLFYAVAAWADDFTGWVIDYGVYPQQGVDYLALRDVKATLESVKPNAGPGGAIHAGLEALTGKLLGGEWGRDDGARMKVERCLIDAGWGESTDLVYNFCRSSPHAAVLTPSHGWGIGAAKRPMHQWAKKPGERAGHNWRMPVMADKRVVRHVIFDANYWKTFIMAALSTPIGDKGCLSLYGLKASRHRMFADHLTAEYPVRTSGYGRSVDEWKLRVEKPDNHLLDCCVGAAVAASMQGVKREGSNQHDTASVAARVRVKASDLQKKKRGY